MVAPGGLVAQWQDEMADRFGLSFAILTRDMIEATKSADPLSEQDLLIARLDHLARNDDLVERLARTEWDLVVDEARHAPRRQGGGLPGLHGPARPRPHWYSRAGDPQLHTHVALANMVRTLDGKWRSLDSRAIYRASRSASERYTWALQSELTARLGARWEERASARNPDITHPEIAGVEKALIDAFSSRGAAIEARLAALVGSYADKHARQPDRNTLARLAQQATLEDRPAPTEHDWATSRSEWLARAGEVLGSSSGEMAAFFSSLLSPTPVPLSPLDVTERAARQVIEALEAAGATFTARDLHTEAAGALRRLGVPDTDTVALSSLTRAVAESPEVVAVAAPELPRSQRPFAAPTGPPSSREEGRPASRPRPCSPQRTLW
ncbi:MAG: MobF family relaxase [Acidimicrobiales bacterium]